MSSREFESWMERGGGGAFWVFSYGSLMWDGWDADYGCLEKVNATLPRFRRAFCKASVLNWGTIERPCPTMGLVADHDGECQGVAFSFMKQVEGYVLDYLRDREGPSFTLERREVALPHDAVVLAYVAVNDANASTYIGDRSLGDLVSLARAARGTKGSCVDYAEGLHSALSEMGIDDAAVEAYWSQLSAR